MPPPLPARIAARCPPGMAARVRHERASARRDALACACSHLHTPHLHSNFLRRPTRAHWRPPRKARLLHDRYTTVTQEAASEGGETCGVGLFDYPVLMASDILLYQARPSHGM